MSPRIETWYLINVEIGSGVLSLSRKYLKYGRFQSLAHLRSNGGKTNHELATELGFSVSTIRHETMRIYQALSVSDRKEAAKKALMLSLV